MNKLNARYQHDELVHDPVEDGAQLLVVQLNRSGQEQCIASCRVLPDLALLALALEVRPEPPIGSALFRFVFPLKLALRSTQGIGDQPLFRDALGRRLDTVFEARAVDFEHDFEC